MEADLERIDYLRFGFSFVRKNDSTEDIAVSWLAHGPAETRPCSSFLSSVGAQSDIIGTGLPCSVPCPVTAPPGWLQVRQDNQGNSRATDAAAASGDARRQRIQVEIGLNHSALLVLSTLNQPGSGGQIHSGGSEDAGGSLYCCGNGLNGQLGDGVSHVFKQLSINRQQLERLLAVPTEASSDGPVGDSLASPPVRTACFPQIVAAQVSQPVGFTSVSCGHEYTLATDRLGRLWAWGRSRDGAMGMDTGGRVITPAVVPSARFFKRSRLDRSERVEAARRGGQAAGSADAAAPIDQEGCTQSEGAAAVDVAVEWGPRALGGAGGTRKSCAWAEGVPDDPSLRAVGVSCGPASSLVWTRGGRLFAAGRNSHGQLGLSTDVRSVKRLEEVNVHAGGGMEEGCAVVQASMGRVHAACVTRDGRLYTWGSNMDGTLCFTTDDGRDINTMTPHRVELPLVEAAAGADRTGSGSPKVRKVCCGPTHTLALDDTGRLFAWGIRATGAVPQESHQAATLGASSDDERIGDTVARSGSHERERMGAGRQRVPMHILGGGSSEGPPVRIVDMSTSTHHSAAVSASGDLYVWGTTSSKLPRLGSPGWLRTMVNPGDVDAAEMDAPTGREESDTVLRIKRPVRLHLQCGAAEAYSRPFEIHAAGQSCAPVVHGVTCGENVTAIEWAWPTPHSRDGAQCADPPQHPVLLAGCHAPIEVDHTRLSRTQLPLVGELQRIERELKRVAGAASADCTATDASAGMDEQRAVLSADRLADWLSRYGTLANCPEVWTGIDEKMSGRGNSGAQVETGPRAEGETATTTTTTTTALDDLHLTGPHARKRRHAGGAETTRPQLAAQLQVGQHAIEASLHRVPVDSQGVGIGLLPGQINGQVDGQVDEPPGRLVAGSPPPQAQHAESAAASGGYRAGSGRHASGVDGEPGCWDRFLYFVSCGCCGRWDAVSTAPAEVPLGLEMGMQQGGPATAVSTMPEVIHDSSGSDEQDIALQDQPKVYKVVDWVGVRVQTSGGVERTLSHTVLPPVQHCGTPKPMK